MKNTLKKIYKYYRDRQEKRIQRRDLLMVSGRRPRHHECRVGFIAQVPEIWNSCQRVFETMLEDDRFDTSLIVIPSFDLVADRLGEYGQELQFFESLYDGKHIRTLNDKDSPAPDLFDYLFYQRPYDYYMPPAWKSDQTRKVTKICYIPYAPIGAYNLVDVMTGDAFFGNVSFCFAESQNIKNILMKKYARDCRKGLRHIEFLGYPRLEECLDQIAGETKTRMHAVWTHRWSYDKKIGGGHIFWSIVNGLLN